MELQTKHINELLNAKCLYVCAVDNLLKKMKYGEPIDDCCKDKLFLAQRLINRLDCYCFPTETYSTTTNGQQRLSVSNNASAVDGTYYLYNGDIPISTYDSTSFLVDKVVSELLNATSLSFTRNAGDINTIFNVVSDCDLEVLKVYRGSTLVYTFTLTLAPVCAVSYSTCYNCIEDSELNKMYQTLNSLLS